MRKRWLVLAAACLAVAILAVPSSASAASKPLFAALSGANEVPAGDRNGGGSFTAVIKGRQMCFGLAVKNIEDPMAAHIHKGRRGVNGDIVVTLVPPSDGDPGASSGCTRLTRRLVRAIRRNPGRYYVNVHTEDFPDGAVRGQLFARGA